MFTNVSNKDMSLSVKIKKIRKLYYYVFFTFCLFIRSKYYLISLN